MTTNRNTYSRWPVQLKIQRGLLNGTYVKLARESRGLTIEDLAEDLGLSVEKLKQQEENWSIWDKEEQGMLCEATNYPLAFFVQDDPLIGGHTFACGHDEDGNAWCEYSDPSDDDEKASE